MGTAHTLSQRESDRVENWYPCISDSVLNLDKNLLRRLSDGDGTSAGTELSYADVTCALRWFNSVPRGFISKEDQALAQELSYSLTALLKS